MHTALSDILSDPSRPVSLRTVAFDRLVLHEDIDTVDKLIDVINREKLSSLKIYMVTRVAHLLESNFPRTKRYCYHLRVVCIIAKLLICVCAWFTLKTGGTFTSWVYCSLLR